MHRNEVMGTQGGKGQREDGALGSADNTTTWVQHYGSPIQ